MMVKGDCHGSHGTYGSDLCNGCGVVKLGFKLPKTIIKMHTYNWDNVFVWKLGLSAYQK